MIKLPKYNSVCFAVITVMFDQITHSVDEDGGSAQPVLVLSKTLPTNFTLQVCSTDRSATGEY